MSKIKVDLKEASYEIIIGSGCIKDLPLHIKKYKPSKIIVITDSNVNYVYGGVIKKVLKNFDYTFVVIPPGEEFKTLYTASAVYDQLLKNNVNRDSLIVAFGGGVVGDLSGFVASTYMRGIPYLNVPTTLLAQVDSSIGGKTGVDHSIGKNLIGSFYQPKAVLTDVQFLRSLPSREIKTGLAEVLKYGIIKDKKIFKALDGNPKINDKFWEEIVKMCSQIKAGVVEKDEKETKDIRIALNLGHTFGHAIESLTNYKKFTHGEAVALGIAAASCLSFDLGILPKRDFNSIITLLNKLKFNLNLKGSVSAKAAIKKMQMDKKVKSSKIRIILPSSIGKIVVRDNIALPKIEKALKQIGCAK